MSPKRVVCPLCGTVVPRESIAIGATLVHCPMCDRLIPVSGPPDQQGERDALVIGLIVLGAGFLVSAVVVVGLMVVLLAGRGERAERAVQAEAGVERPVRRREEPAASEQTEGPAASPAGSVQLGDGPAESSTPAGDSAKSGSSRLRYHWKPGESYMYFFEVEAKLGDSVEKLSGSTHYRVESADEASAGPGEVAEIQEGTGTGFVVHSDGYLVTCAHVVEGATEIKVRLDDRTDDGRIVATDEDHDLALIRVSPGGLPALPLAESDQVELAQEVLAVGYPLSDVLGETVKVTQGTVAGIFEREGIKLFQIDASINPGNSGGPLVNQRGEVVGIASAKLTGSEISNVGFAVPVNDAKRLLRAQGVAFQPGGAEEELAGPELARRVSPSVALLSVKGSLGGAGGGKRFTLHCLGHFDTSTQSGGGMVVPEGMTHTSGKLVVDELGHVLEISGEEQLPYLLGPPEALPIEQLPRGSRRSWKSENALLITQVKEEEGWGYPGLPGFRRPSAFPRPPSVPRPPSFPRIPRSIRPPVRPGFPRYPSFSPFAEPATTVNTFPAMERIVYELGKSSGETVTIKKRYELKPLVKSGQAPPLEMVGQGEIVFNKKTGLPESMQYRATLSRTAENVTLRIPLTVTYERYEEGEADESAKPPGETKKPSGPAAPSPAPPASEADPEKKLDQVLQDLQAAESNWSKQYIALGALSAMKPIEPRREEVAGILQPWLTNSNSSLQTSAVQAIGVWGTKQNVPTLLKLLESQDTSLRLYTIQALGKIPDERGVEALVELVKDPSDRFRAANALRGMGSVAEDKVIELLEHEDYQVRSQACHVLGEIGGPKSVAALKKQLESDTHHWSRAAAEIALRKLEKQN